MSSFTAHQRIVAWPHGHFAAPRFRREPRDAAPELGFRFAAVQVGYWLGWASITVVLGGLALDVGIRHRWFLIAATLAAAAGNTAAMVIPWREWLGSRRGRILLDLWSGGLLAFVALLVIGGGSNFALLAADLIPLSVGATAMRLGLVGAVVAVALVLTRTIRRETAAHKDAAERAELERTLAREANHRIKNDLQTAADLLLLARPSGAEGVAFDETAARIRSIATVHRLLTEAEDRVDGGALLRSITAGAPVGVTVEADAMRLDAATAQKLGIVANELVTNAFRHGAAPIVVRLDAGPEARLQVDDGGNGAQRPEGFGLDLVRHMVEHGLAGRFELAQLPSGGTRAEVVFPLAAE